VEGGGVTDTQARLDAAVRLLPELRLRFRTSPAHPIHTIFDALAESAAELERVTTALRELKRRDYGGHPYGDHIDPRSTVRVIDDALAGGARTAQEDA
jgi:hypothetical protein